MPVLVSYLFFMIFTPLCLGISALGIALNPKHWKSFLPLMVLSIGVLSYSYNPTVETDLTRYYQMSEMYSSMSLRQALIAKFPYYVPHVDNNLWIAIVFFWLIGRMGTVHLIPMLASIIVYGIAFYISCDIAEDYSCTQFIPYILLFQFCALPYVSILNNIRNVSAFALFVLAVYLDLVKRKRNIGVLLLYILPAFIHASVIVLIILRLITKISKKIRNILLLVIFLRFFYISIFIYNNFAFLKAKSGIGSMIWNAIFSANWYLTQMGNDEWANHVKNSTFQQINRLYFIIIAIIVLLLIVTRSFHVEDKYDDFINFMFLLSVMTLAFAWFVNGHLWRLCSALMMIIAAIAIPLIMNHNNMLGSVVINISWLIMILGLALQLWANKTSVNYLNWGENFLLNNIYVIIFETIRGLLRI